MMTSLEPKFHGVQHVIDHLDPSNVTLAEHLGSQGYATRAVVCNGLLFSTVEQGLFQGFKDSDVSWMLEERDLRAAEKVTNLAISTIKNRGQQPFFLWVHYFDPHDPYLFHPEFDFGRSSDIDRYDSDIAYTDQQIGRLLIFLDDQNLSEDTIVVFTADHGEEFGDHGGTNHGHALYEELVHVPLIIRVPGFTPQRIEDIVRHINVGPTLLSLARLSIPDSFQGDSFPIEETGFKAVANRPAIFETRASWAPAPKQGIRKDQWKLIATRLQGEPDIYELYDLSQDPFEQENLADQNHDLVISLLSLL